jgi:SET domain-containing protein
MPSNGLRWANAGGMPAGRPEADLGREGRMAFMQSDAVEVKRARGKGRGVFARRPIRKGEVIERVPVLVMSAEEYVGGVDQSPLAGYVFAWGEGQIALALGYGSLYNHSFKPNARYQDVPPRTKQFVALRDIGAGEEVTVNYNGTPKSRAKVWFNLAEEAMSSRSSGARGGVG